MVCGYNVSMDHSAFKCPKCDYSHTNLNSLRIHWCKFHKLQSVELRITLLENGIRPTCKCGCGEKTRFESLQLGFADFVNGHNNRVHNNWGHNAKARENSITSRHNSHERGEWTAWNKGETKETHKSVAAYGKSGSQTLRSNPDHQQQRSEHMSSQWKTRSIVPLTGSSHSQWRGGTSALQPVCRSHLHSVWVFPKLKASGFACEKCGAKDSLEVHHDGERFAEILQKAVKALGEVQNDSFEQKSLIAEWVSNYHVENNVSGIVLCAGCHDNEHSSLGIAANTYDT